MDAEHSSDRPVEEVHAAIQAFQQHRALLYSVAYSMLGDSQEAERVVQETRARWLAESYAGSSRSPDGLMGLATYLAFTRLRAAQSNGESHIGPWVPEPLQEELELSLAESISAAMSTIVDTMLHDERIVFLLHRMFGMSFAEIAAVTGRAESNVRRIDAEAGARVRCEVRPLRPGRPGLGS